MAEQANQAEIILLSHEHYADIPVIPENRDQFVLTVEDAVRACKAYDNQLAFSNQFEHLLEELSQWIIERKDVMSSAHLSIRENGLRLIVVQKNVEYDRELAEALVDLDLHIANAEEYRLIDLDVMAVPHVSRDSLVAFLSSGQVFSYAK